MLPHPKTMQTVVDQHWHELRVEVGRERLAMTALEQTLVVTPIATLRLRIVNTIRWQRPIFGRRPEVRLSGDAQQLGIP